MTDEELILYFENLIIWIEENCYNDETKLILKAKLYFEINKLKRKNKSVARRRRVDEEFDVKKDYLCNSLAD